MTTKRATQILGEKADDMSDDEVQGVVSQLEMPTYIDSYLVEQSKKDGNNNA